MRIGRQLHEQLEKIVRRHPWSRWPLVLALLVLVAIFGRVEGRFQGPPTDVPGGAELSGFAKVIDGDSLRIGGSEIRLKDIDAPEGRQTCRRDGQDWACGEDARRALQRFVGGKKVVCRSVERDKHDRYLAYCDAGGRTLNEAMVEAGFAVSYGGYRNREREAKTARRGVWGSEFQMPRDWRHDRGIGQ